MWLVGFPPIRGDYCQFRKMPRLGGGKEDSGDCDSTGREGIEKRGARREEWGLAAVAVVVWTADVIKLL